jgi:hypothetical protein
MLMAFACGWEDAESSPGPWATKTKGELSVVPNWSFRKAPSWRTQLSSEFRPNSQSLAVINWRLSSNGTKYVKRSPALPWGFPLRE